MKTPSRPRLLLQIETRAPSGHAVCVFEMLLLWRDRGKPCQQGPAARMTEKARRHLVLEASPDQNPDRRFPGHRTA